MGPERDGFVVHGPDGDKTREQHFGEDVPMLLAAFPDLALHVPDSFAEGTKVVTRFIFTGTHKGEFQGIAATGTEIQLPGIVIERVEAGKVAEASVQRNDLWLLQQIGSVPTSHG